MPIGSNFDDFLQDEGYLNEVDAAALKAVMAWKAQQLDKKNNTNKE